MGKKESEKDLKLIMQLKLTELILYRPSEFVTPDLDQIGHHSFKMIYYEFCHHVPSVL